MTKKFALIIAFFLFSGSVYAEDYKKISLAIMEFRANNTKDSFGNACLDILSEKLFASKLFTLMEKSQMDKIARLNGFKEFNSIDPKQIAKLGRILKVDKMLVGSITYLDSYIIDVKVFDVGNGEIEFNANKKINSIEKLESALDDISITIERHYLGYYRLSGTFDIALEAHYLNPFGTFGKAVDRGLGVQAVITLNSAFRLPFDVQAITGYYCFRPGNESIDNFNMFPLYLCAAYKFGVARNIKFIPSAGFGYVFSRISTNDSANKDDLYWRDKKLYYNPAIVIRTEFDLFLIDRWYIVFTPQYNIFFVSDKVGQFASLGLGVKMLF
ncbi:MAG: CsgG/HfaB family protein [Spirochaetota bacterium]